MNVTVLLYIILCRKLDLVLLCQSHCGHLPLLAMTFQWVLIVRLIQLWLWLGWWESLGVDLSVERGDYLINRAEKGREEKGSSLRTITGAGRFQVYSSAHDSGEKGGVEKFEFPWYHMSHQDTFIKRKYVVLFLQKSNQTNLLLSLLFPMANASVCTMSGLFLSALFCTKGAGKHSNLWGSSVDEF